MKNMKYINYLDLFSGIGGFALGLQKVGFRFKNHYYSEVDKYAIQIYKKRFPNAIGFGDIKKINGKEFKEIGIITFGSPCQGLSIAGKGEGLKDKRSYLFFEAIRIIQECKPHIFIFENVEGLLSSNEGKDFEIVLREIANLGLYECEWQLCNTTWVLPQNRERIYLIGYIRKESRQKIFPIRENDKAYNERKERTESETQFCTSILGEAMGKGGGHIPIIHNMMPRSGNPKQGGTGHLTRNDGKVYNIDTGNTNAIEYKNNIRRLTPKECERLQGFPDEWTKGLSDTRRYICLGNAVTVDIVEEIGRRIHANNETITE